MGSLAVEVDVVELEKIDLYHDNKKADVALDEIKAIYEKDPSSKKNPEVLWRLTRAYHFKACSLDAKEPKRKQLILDGHKHGIEAYEVDKTNFNVIKWTAIVIGSMTDYLPTKERIQQGNEFKRLCDEGLAIDPTDTALLHSRGRFAYNVASLSWLERKAAATFFAQPPKATFEEAIADFLEVEKLRPEHWLENKLFIAKTYLAKDEKKEAIKWLKEAANLEPEDDPEKEALKEIRQLLQKYAK